MASFENLLIGISKGFCTAQDDKIVNAMALTSTNLQNSKFLCNFYFGDCVSEENLYEAEEKEISNILY
jgi:hypothetical protein